MVLMRGVPALLLGAVAALLPIERAAAQSAAILPVTGDQRLADRLNPVLGRAVAGRGLPMVLGPVEVKARLMGAPAVAAALDRVWRSIAQAREHELRMDRPAALATALEATRALEEIRGALYLPDLMIRAHTSLALAALLQPDDPQAAKNALGQVVALDPGYRPAPGQLSAQATRLLDEARSRARPHRPEARDLAWVAQQIGLSRLLWIGLARRDGERVRLEAVLYDHSSRRVRKRLELETTTARLQSDAAGLVVRALEGLRARRKTAPPPPPRPWYRRWWVWAVVGTVAAGAGVWIGVAMTRPQEGSVTTTESIHFHF
jgi:hypothetical protein